LRKIQIPIDESEIRSLKVGDVVSLSGIMVTARDAAHKYMVETFVEGEPEGEDLEMQPILEELLQGGVVYHCGPVVAKEGDEWKFVAAGPTTSIREEPYEADVIARFGVRGIVGKGGLGPKTLKACKEHGCAYLHAVGGAATFIADSVEKVLAVHREDLGTPEAFWVIRVKDFPVVVTMDASGTSLHEEVRAASGQVLGGLLGL
jgi:fumarate hydratase class I